MNYQLNYLDNHEKYMKYALDLDKKGRGSVSPNPLVGCVIVKGDRVVGEGANRVLAENDPTCHGEISAIRSACSALGTHDLSGSTMYTSSEPCPMCYAAAWWARIDKIYYGSTVQDSVVKLLCISIEKAYIANLVFWSILHWLLYIV